MRDLLAASSLWRREVVRFLRQPSRVISAAATPLLFWVFVGTGLSSSFRLPEGPGEIDFLEYFFPGTVVLLVLFGTISATFSVIDDRHDGFLQGVLVSPVSRFALVIGKVFGGASLAWLQGMVFLLLAPLAGIGLSGGSMLQAAGVMALLALALTGLGFALAWRIDSTQGFHGIMNLLLIPMWLLSGAFFPLAGAPTWLAWVMRLNPLTYGMAALRRVLYMEAESLGEGVPDLGLSLGVLTIWALAVLIADLALVRRGQPV